MNTGSQPNAGSEGTQAAFVVPPSGRGSGAGRFRLKAGLRTAWLAFAVAPVALFTVTARAQDTTWVYAVQLAATVQTSPPRIELSWPADHLPVSHYLVYRKAPGEAAWGEGTMLGGDATSFVDENVAAGTRYEYQVEKQGERHRGFGYITVGVESPLADQRGKIVLVVDNSIAGHLEGELHRFQQDLAGDGWIPIRKDVSREDRPADVRGHIQHEFNIDRERVRAVVLIGRVPVVRSGNLNVDGHRARPLPADVYYAEMDGEWTDANGDGILDQNLLPSDAELQIGRIDFAELSGRFASSAYPGEVELLKRYFEKNHAFRNARTRPTPRALIADTIGSGNGQAYAASAYRNVATTVGSNTVMRIPTALETPVEQRLITQLAREDYMWVFGSGAGSDLTISNLGTHGEFNDLWATDFVDAKLKGTFYFFFGSWMVDWAQPDNFLRSALTAPDFGLTAAWSGRPHLFLHAMGSGDTIGQGVRASQNNNGQLYQNNTQRQLRGIHVALLGDPTLRQHMIAPTSEVNAGVSGSDVHVTWKASADPVSGYHVYRGPGPHGPFTRLTESPVGDTRFVAAGRASEGATYMVRAVALQSGASGTYWNASQGAMVSFAAGAPAAVVSPTSPEPSRDVNWVDDAVPAGALALAANDRWNWVNSDPAPFSGTLAHRSELAAGLHHHFFANATTPITVDVGDTFYAYVYVDPANPPRTIMLTWCAENWEHRAYWGENLITEGIDGSAGRKHMGALPPTGQWVRLEVPASAVDLERRSVTGMGFTLFDGRVTWDRAGKMGR